MMRRAGGLILAGVWLLAACGDDDPRPGGDGGGPDAGPNDPDGGAGDPVFDVSTIEGCGQAGFQTVAAANAAGKVAFASIALETSTSLCTVEGRDPAATAEHSVCYVETTDGATFTDAEAVVQQYVAMTGVGLALEAGGTARLALAGGATSRFRCGGTDLVVLSGDASGFGAPQTIATDSASGGLVPDQEEACAAQNVCNMGDCVGYFPAIAIDANGASIVAFRDLHFGFANDDFASSDVELVRGTGAMLTIDVARGGGLATRIGLDPATGRARVAHYNHDGADEVNGVWVNVEGEAGWTASRVARTTVGEQIGFAVGLAGQLGLAYHDEARAVLVYRESADGVTWDAPVDVDSDGVTGQFPSLAFDAAGEPAIAYYRCRDYHPTERSCDQARDGIYLARRSGASWRRHRVRADGGVFDGLYTALAFRANKAVVAYQSRWYDPSSGTNDVKLHIARER